MLGRLGELISGMSGCGLWVFDINEVNRRSGIGNFVGVFLRPLGREGLFVAIRGPGLRKEVCERVVVLALRCVSARCNFRLHEMG